MTTDQTPAAAAGPGVLSVETNYNPKRRAYAVRLLLDDQAVVRMDSAAALKHAAAVLVFAQHAEYDAAVARQFINDLGTPMEMAGFMVTQLRETRRTPSKLDTAPLELSTLVTPELYGAVAIHLKGRQVGQWTVADARAHASFVLETVEAAKLDTLYRRYLVDSVGLDENRASQVVHHVGQHRPDPTK